MELWNASSGYFFLAMCELCSGKLVTGVDDGLMTSNDT